MYTALYHFFTCVHTLTEIFLTFAANKEYYHQWSVEECQGCSLDLSTFTIEELDNITSEYTLKNTVSLQSSLLIHTSILLMQLVSHGHYLFITFSSPRYEM